MKELLLYVARIVIAAILIVYLVKSLGVERIKETIETGNILPFIFACTLVPVFILLKSKKWHEMVLRAGTHEKYCQSIRAILVGLGFGLFTPGRAGEIIRIRYYTDIDKIMVGGLVVIDRIIDLITIIMVSVYFFYSRGLIIVSVLLLIVSTIAIVSMRKIVDSCHMMPTHWQGEWYYDFFRKISLGAKALSLQDMIVYCSLSFINWGVLIIQYYLILNTFTQTSLKIALATLPILQISNLIPITIAGLGVRENLSVYVMQLYNIEGTVAAMSALFLFILDIMLPGIMGIVIYLSVPHSQRGC